MKKRFAVVGTGTAGMLSLCHLLTNLKDGEWEVHSIYDPAISILGIGESTTASIPYQLGKGAMFSLFRDAKELDATIKYGVKYVNWREHDIFSRFPIPHYGIHFNNFKLHGFCEQRFKEIWGKKFTVKHCAVSDITKEGVVKTEKFGDLHYDWVVDCRGWPEDYTDYEISSSVPVNSAMVNIIDKPGDWEWTYHKAMPNGWMFGIPLTTRQGWGYLYNQDVTDREEIISDLKKEFGDKLNTREFFFKNYYAKNVIEGRVIKNGNRALFLEPLEALSGFFYENVMRISFDYIFFDMEVNKGVDYYNDIIRHSARMNEMFMAFIYHGGSNYDTPFWTMAKDKARNKLSSWIWSENNIPFFEDLRVYMNEMSLNERLEDKFVYQFTRKQWHELDKQFGYNYWTKPDEPIRW